MIASKQTNKIITSNPLIYPPKPKGAQGTLQLPFWQFLHDVEPIFLPWEEISFHQKYLSNQNAKD